MQGFLALDRAGCSGSNDTLLSPLPSLCCLHSQAASSKRQCSFRNLNENACLLNIPRESGCLYALPSPEPIMVPKGMQSSDWPGLGQPGRGRSPRMGEITPTQVWTWTEGVGGWCFPEKNQDVIPKGRVNGNWTKKTTNDHPSQVNRLYFRWLTYH